MTINPPKTPKREKPSLFQRAWILSDGKIGDLVQCEGVACALGVETDTRIVSPAMPWVWMLPFGLLPPADKISRKTSPIRQPLPDLVIASGWRTLAYVREIKKQQKNRVFAVFLKMPRTRADYLDLIWVPRHDRLRGEKVISSIAGPHRYSPEVLAEEYDKKPDILKNLPRPLVGVLLGGDSRDYTFAKEDSKRLAKSLRSIASTGAGLAITPSRRSPDHLLWILKSELRDMPVYWWDEQTPNPYGSILSNADYFVVTADSANMVGEVCVTGKPVYVFRPSGGSKKFDRLLRGIEAHGASRPLPLDLKKLDSWSYEPLYTAREIADEIEIRAARQFGIAL